MAKKKTTKKAKPKKAKVAKKPVKPKAKMGRPTKYKEEFNKYACKLAEKGFTDKELAEMFGVTEKTLNLWKKDYPDFLQSLKEGKEIADQKVKMALFQRATGYSHPSVHVSQDKGVVTLTPIIKHYPPDTTACIFWLKNRCPDEFRDKVDHEHGITDALSEFIKEVSGSGKGLPISDKES